MHILNKFFDRVVCLSLVERDDKYQHVKRQFETLGINVEFHHAVIHPFNRQIGEAISEIGVGKFNYQECHNEFACSREHYTIIKKAYLDRCKSILVFEDDISFHHDFNDLIGSYLDSLPNDWDLTMLTASSETRDLKRVNSKWLRANRCWSTAAYALTRDNMKTYLSYQQRFYCQADMPLYMMQKSKKYACYLPAEPLMIPNPKFDSDIRLLESRFVSEYESDINVNDYF